MTNSIAQAAVGVERIQAILETDSVIRESPTAREPGAIRGDISFDHVAFGYNKDEPVLLDVSFTVKQGELVGIVGTTGGGKSTVVSLIPRFYDPTSGFVRIDGVDIREYQTGSSAQPNRFRAARHGAVPRDHTR